MATTVAILEAKLRADTSDFNRKMGDADTGMQKAGKGISKAAKFAGLAIAGGLGVAAKIGFDEFKQGQLVTAQTNAVIKSTGGIANVTEKQLDKLSTSMMKKTGIDDEAIKSGGNVLLTFTKIRNETGRGNKIFDEATKAVLDMSTALGTDLTKTSIQVGKALNDPIKGASALRRVGVQLTEVQERQIKMLVEGLPAHEALFEVYEGKVTPAMIRAAKEMSKTGSSWQEIAKTLDMNVTPAQARQLESMTEGGKTVQAQKIILRELNTEFGGSAEAAGKTLPGQLAILRESFNNLMGQIVGAVIPRLVAVIGFFREHSTVTKVLIGSIAAFVAILLAAGAAIKVYQGVMLIARAATATWTAVQWLLNAALTANPIGLVIVAVAALAAAVVIAWRRSETFRDIVKGLWEVLKITPLGLVIAHLDDVARKMAAAGEKAVAFGKVAVGPVDAVADSFRSVWRWIDRMIDGIKWLIDHAGKIPLIGGGGDPFDPRKLLPPQGPVGAGRMDISPKLWDELSAAQSFGLVMTSGYRPGAITASGTRSDHSYYPSKAIDVSGSSGSMARFFTWLIGQRDVKQAFYDPLGSIFNGVLSNYREGGHSDHVHVATYDKGGFLRPGWNLAYNGLGRPEPVGAGGGGDIHIHLTNQGVLGSRADVVAWLRNAAQEFKRRNGRGLV